MDISQSQTEFLETLRWTFFSGILWLLSCPCFEGKIPDPFIIRSILSCYLLRPCKGLTFGLGRHSDVWRFSWCVPRGNMLSLQTYTPPVHVTIAVHPVPGLVLTELTSPGVFLLGCGFKGVVKKNLLGIKDRYHTRLCIRQWRIQGGGDGVDHPSL